MREIQLTAHAYGERISNQRVSGFVGEREVSRSHWGVPVDPEVSGIRAVELVPAEIQEPVIQIDRSNRCIANDDTCKAYRANGTDMCVGHGRSVKVA